MLFRSVSSNVATYGGGANMAVAANTSSAAITINGVSINATYGSTNTTAQNRAVTVGAINNYFGQTGVMAIDTGSDSTGVKLVAADGRNITIGTTITATVSGLAAAATYFGGFTLTAASAISVQKGSGTLSQSGLTAGTYAAQQAAAVTANSVTNANLTSIAAGDITINGVVVGGSSAYDLVSTTSNATSALAKAAAINAVKTQSGVTATASTTITYAGAAMAATANTSSSTITINNVSIGVSLASTNTTAQNRVAVVQAINAVQGQTGVVATDTGTDVGGITLAAADGRNIDATNNFSAANVIGITTGTYKGGVSLTSTGSFTIAQGSTNATVYNSLGLYAGTYGEGRTGKALSSLDLTTAAGASTALTSIDNAINSINTFSATLGAIQNRFSSTVSNLQVYSNNLQASKSRITDADFASETTALSRAQVLQQAGTAILAQANALPQQVLTLLR